MESYEIGIRAGVFTAAEARRWEGLTTRPREQAVA